jgi:hypothetical protein
MNKLDVELAQLNSELIKTIAEGEKIRGDLIFFETFNEFLTREEISTCNQKKEAYPEIFKLVVASVKLFRLLFYSNGLAPVAG